MGKRLAVVILLLLLTAFVPPVSAQLGKLSVSGEIILVRGDYSSGSLSITNEAPVAYSVVSYQRFWVEDELGRFVGGFNLTISPRAFSSWKSEEEKVISYNLSCSENVSPGNYTLHLRFIGMTGGKLVVITAEVPVSVLPSSLIFKTAEVYVPGRGASSYVFLGEKIVVYSHIVNIGHKAIPVESRVVLERGGKRYYSERRTLNVPPGDSMVKFSIPVSVSYPEGSYTLIYTLNGTGEKYTFTKNLTVLAGLKLVGVSLQRSSVGLNQGNSIYVTLLSERKANASLKLTVMRGNTTILQKVRKLELSPGTNVLELSLPTGVSGNLTAIVGLFLGNRLVDSEGVSYFVSAPPKIENVRVEFTQGKLRFRLLISNPGNAISCLLNYTISRDGKVVYKDSIVQNIPHGNSTVNLIFDAGPGSYTYAFSLKAGNEVSTVTGNYSVPSPVTSTTKATTSSSTSTGLNSTSSSLSRGSGGGFPVGVLALLVVIILGLIGWYYWDWSHRASRRSRPKPKRRSPLGRFRRPKRPSFKEKDSLPKK